ncbi:MULTISPECIES: signal peptidase II [unclassified Micromonospora]|uniref:signal peptidase II n=1 Tax=unclassified Micromonospora TaxID=2617518 RepID=UPI0022B6F5DB|nr:MULTISPECIES: signal peptidase II [unclassified Micromonospora]MCZ7418096.1 signal peptidase II [Verrucosispora sp. WMMA2121]WBB91851.1 signal peptidase II [Verrucosispora sp. WMMC514]
MSAAPQAGSGIDGSGRATRSRRRSVTILLSLAVFAVAVDLLTKHLSLQELGDREPVRLLGGALYLSLTRNSGAAWSLGKDYTFIFPIIAIGVLAWIAWMARTLRSVPWAVALGLVVGGVVGNLIDRIFRAPGWFVGHVVDMFSVFDPYGRVFPIFNVADSALVCGVLLAVGLEFTGRQRDGTRAQADDRAGGTDRADTPTGEDTTARQPAAAGDQGDTDGGRRERA